MSDIAEAASRYATLALTGLADPHKAAGMQAYMKTDMPFFGVQAPARSPVVEHLVAHFRPADRAGYEDLVSRLWALPHREEKYLAIAVAEGHEEFIQPGALQLYRRMIVEGAWWDLVDAIAIGLVGALVLAYPLETWPEVDTWIDHDDMWLRRSALICQVGAKVSTDVDRLLDFCSRTAHEEEFFIRKAIGWALREFARTDPDTVARFAVEHRDELSGLSFREATKHIGHLVDP